MAPLSSGRSAIGSSRGFRRRQIFRPFFASRDGAMGLGLTMAGHLVKKYEGGIKVDSLPGQGTVTRITLPTGIPGPRGVAPCSRPQANDSATQGTTGRQA